MDKEKVQLIAFDLIAHAGDAFNHYFSAVELASDGQFDKADEEMLLGDQALNESHKSQTSMLTAEANNEDVAFSVILIHAQDHLMTTIMYSRIAKQMIELHKKITERG